MDLQLDSGPPWRLECHVRAIGDDYVCTILGGDRHVGAVALSEWVEGKARTRSLSAQGHRERALATEAAHRLCRVTHRRVSCIAGIHFDRVTSEQIGTIVRDAQALIRRAETRLERQRLERSLADSLLPRIEARRENYLRKFDELQALTDEQLEPLRERAAPLVSRYFAGKVNLFAPLYLSNGCSNDCAYCGFRHSAHFRRTRLSIDEALREARRLVELGHRTIDLVTGEIATDRFVDYVCEVTRAILEKTRLRRINLNLGALTTDQFRRLASAGARSYHLYQETYCPRTYFDVHRSGLKRDMAYRLSAPHRAADADFDSIGLGVLLGLHTVRDDMASLAAHAEVLTEDFPTLRLGFSLPRLQRVDAECGYRAAAAVDDVTFVRALLFLRLQFPQAHVTLTTRERPEIRDRLIDFGVTKLSAGVSTAPGGYEVDPSATVQFDIADPRPLPDIVALVRRAGWRPSFG